MRMISLFWILLLIGCSSVSSPVLTPNQPTATSPVKPTSTTAATPTPDVYATDFWVTSTAIVDVILTAEPGRIYRAYPSPDQKWTAEIRIFDCVQVNTATDADANAYEQLNLIENSSNIKKSADGQLQNCSGVGAVGLEGLYWSSNSHYFYYTNASRGVPDGGCGYWEKPVLRLYVGALKIDELGGGPVSPDRTKIATWQGKEIVVWDINMGTEIGRLSPFVLNTEMWTGPMIWSPDSQALVYVQTESYCPPSGNSRVVRVNLPDLEQTILFESETPTFASAHWNKIDELRLFDENGKQWAYDFDTQKLKRLP